MATGSLSSALSYANARPEIVYIAKLMYDHFLTDSAGGNIAVRVSEEHVLVTPSHMSQDFHCVLSENDLILVDMHGKIIEGHHAVSRETAMHLGLFALMPVAKASVHGHPRYASAFAADNKPIPSCLEEMSKTGTIMPVKYAPAGTPELAKNVVEHFRPMAANITTDPGLGAILPKHGIVTVSITLNKAFDLLERIEVNAMCTLFSRLIDPKANAFA